MERYFFCSCSNIFVLSTLPPTLIGRRNALCFQPYNLSLILLFSSQVSLWSFLVLLQLLQLIFFYLFIYSYRAIELLLLLVLLFSYLLTICFFLCLPISATQKSSGYQPIILRLQNSLKPSSLLQPKTYWALNQTFFWVPGRAVALNIVLDMKSKPLLQGLKSTLVLAATSKRNYVSHCRSCKDKQKI